MRTLHVRVAGVTYENRQSILARLHGNEPIRLEPEPTNKYDPNAIAVKVALLTPISVDRQVNDPNGISDVAPEREMVIYHCGYIPREIAAQIAPVMDGESFMCKIEEVTGGFSIGENEIANYGLRLIVELPDAGEVV